MDRNRVGQHFPNFEKDFKTGQQVGWSPVMNRGELLHTPSASIIPKQMMITMPRGGHDRLEPQGQQLTGTHTLS